MERQATWAECIEAALLDFGRFLMDSDWYGRENELVNLFAHSFLAGSAGPSGPVLSAQLGIEVAVRQLARPGGKALVRKDLVVWSTPKETVWSKGVATNTPAAIVEFKINNRKKCDYDLEWLSAYTKLYPSVVAYSVCGHVEEPRGVWFVPVINGKKGAAQRVYDKFSS
jgi:hypothetical protein